MIFVRNGEMFDRNISYVYTGNHSSPQYTQRGFKMFAQESFDTMKLTYCVSGPSTSKVDFIWKIVME